MIQINKSSSVLEFSAYAAETDARIELIGLIDHEPDVEIQSAWVQELAIKMVLLG